MATTRIKDLSKTATTVNSDANLVLDGNTGGTQKITRDNFRQDTADAFVAAPGTYNLAPINSGTGKIDATYLPTSSDTPKGAWNASTNTPTLADGSGTAGDYYDVTVAGSSDLGSGSITFTVGDVVKYNGTTWFKIDSVTNILDGVSTIDGAKAAIEIPTVGSSPNEVSLNGQLGTMAFQDSAGVSVGQLEADQIGIGTSSPDSTLEVTGASATSNNGATVLVTDNASVAADIGGTIALRGTDGSTDRTFAVVKGGKRDGTSAFDGYLSLQTRSNGQANTTEAVHIDSSQQVGIGLSNPGDYNSATRDLVVGATTSNHGISIVAGTGSASAISFADSDDSTAGRIQYDHATNSLKFRVNGGEKWSINSSGNLVSGASEQPIDLTGNGILQAASNLYLRSTGSSPIVFQNGSATRWTIDTSGNFVSSGGGIDFGTTTTGSGTPSGGLLNDYEEGTATISDSSGAGLTYTGTACNYIKVGNKVTVWITVTFPTTSDGSSATIGGLPYAFGSSTVDQLGGSLTYTDLGSSVSILGNAGTSAVTIRNHLGQALVNSAMSGKTIWFSVTYDVS